LVTGVQTCALPISAARDKKHVVYEAGHCNLPQQEEVRESLNWLDKYLGPVPSSPPR